MPEFKETFDYHVEVIRSTDLSLLVRIDDKEIFMPFSQICDSSEITHESEAGEEGIITVSEWIAVQEGLE